MGNLIFDTVRQKKDIDKYCKENKILIENGEINLKYDRDNGLMYISEEDKNWFPDSFFAEERAINFKPTEEQQKFIDYCKQGKDVLVNACIGSGKTTTIQWLCNELIKDNENIKILYFTYNRILKVEAQTKIVKLQAIINNYDGFAYRINNRASLKDWTKSKEGQPEFFNEHFKEIEYLLPTKVDVIILDEYQDLFGDASEMLNHLKVKYQGVQVIAVGDLNQKISVLSRLNAKQFLDGFMSGDKIEMEFTICHRLSKDSASHCGKIWGTKIVGVNENEQTLTATFNELVEIVGKDEVKVGDILVIGKSNGIMMKFQNEIEKRYPEKFNKSNVFSPIQQKNRVKVNNNDEQDLDLTNCIIFATYDSIKGLERKIVIIFDYTEEFYRSRVAKNVPYEIVRNLFMVAISRGSYRNYIYCEYNPKNPPPKPPKVKFLTDKVLQEPYLLPYQMGEPFIVEEMYDYNYTEDTRDCYKALTTKDCSYYLQNRDKSVLNLKSADGLIDLSPCLKLAVLSHFFDNFDLREEFERAINVKAKKDKTFLYEELDEKGNIVLETVEDNGEIYERVKYRDFDDCTDFEKILIVMANQTRQERYIKSVNPENLFEKDFLEKCDERLSQFFDRSESVQNDCEFDFSANTTSKIQNEYIVLGRYDIRANVNGEDAIVMVTYDKPSRVDCVRLGCYLAIENMPLLKKDDKGYSTNLIEKGNKFIRGYIFDIVHNELLQVEVTDNKYSDFLLCTILGISRHNLYPTGSCQCYEDNNTRYNTDEIKETPTKAKCTPIHFHSYLHRVKDKDLTNVKSIQREDDAIYDAFFEVNWDEEYWNSVLDRFNQEKWA